MKKQLAVLALASALAACGGQAHAANTNDQILNPNDGRLYSFVEAQSITQNSPSSFTISYAGGTSAVIGDISGAKFAALKNAPGFANSFAQVANFSGQAVYVNLAASSYQLCSGGYLTIGYIGAPGTATYSDPACSAFSALKASAN